MSSLLESLFSLKEHKTNIKTEVLAGITTFMTMAYIIFVNPSIVKATGMPFEAVMIATAMSAAFATLCMAFLANYPFALAPGMGLNAYFTYTVVLGMGLSWQEALGAVFISGVVFLLLTLTKIRETIINAMPATLKSAVSAGIGLFIAFIGMQGAGIVVNSDATLVTLGDLTNPSAFLAIVGLIITGLLMAKGVKGSILWGIIITTILAIPLGVAQMPEKIIELPTLATWSPVLFKADISGALGKGILTIVFAFLFVDLFDTAGTLVGVSQQAGFLDEDGNLPKVEKALLADSVGTIAGSMMGTPTVTTYVESASGVAQGGRTGLTGVVVALCFILSIFFTPVIAIVPAAATAPALIIVGALMLKNVVYIQWDNIAESLAAFVTIVAMPFTYSIATGISLGFIIYPIIKFFYGEGEDVHWIVYLLGFLFIVKYIYL
ncbi:AGZA family xanthine/uracil permease-like MFS transporter [Orenia metallireducens]|uniref:Putative MFS transporter, AGZA family, xanthine/uracil permease n=1 Tax=Orenia metallireducens TaxID=1413210 RepID=A0A285GJ57_9FIRM|nr:NCS2 family permease [Orenia metallireducens]PRX30434.1 AGZA family xanthine/uracil permease-like MFS transporter [Orenia metallireducens]SNY22526.1 putative MFS transporter, AGZA family, xanthine/uracil permease [Orenia metallireducens]